MASIWGVRGNLLANFGPTGYLGVLSLWGLLVPGLIVVETALAGGPMYTEPGENTIAIWAIATVGTMITLYWLSRKNRWFAGVVAGLVSLSAVGWAVMGYTALPLKYTMVSNQGARVLTKALHTIPQNAEVIASQGIIGRFADRSHAYILGFSTTPVVTRSVYFVISPYQGINPMPQQAIFSRMTYLVDTLHVSVLTHTDNVWVYKWIPPPSVHSVVWPGMRNNIPAWTLESSVGHHILTGPVARWHLSADNTRAGYVMNGDYWRLGMGNYQASVKLQTTGSVNVEVWNDTGNLLLARR